MSLAWPAIATNITTPLLSLADVAIVGHLADGKLIGAVAVGGTLFNILYWMFAFLRMGTSGMTAQAYGAGNRVQQRDILKRGLLIALSAGILLPIIAQIIGMEVIHLVAGTSDIDIPAFTYFSLTICGAPGVLITYAVSGWLLGMQRSRPIMWIVLTTNILNILLSLLFVYGLNFGITGVAMGTAFAQLTGGIIGLVVVSRISRNIIVSGSIKGSWLKSGWKPLFRINTDIFLRTVCLSAVTLWFTHAGATIGGNILSANALLMQLFLIFSYFMDGFAFGGEALAGRYYGAGDNQMLNTTVKALFRWGIITSLLFTLVYFVFGDVFLEWLTDDIEVAKVACDYRFWAVVVPFAGFSAFTWDGIMIGLTKTRALLASMGVAMAVFFAIYFVGTSLYDNLFIRNHVLWLAFIVYLGVRGLLLTYMYKRLIQTKTL